MELKGALRPGPKTVMLGEHSPIFHLLSVSRLSGPIGDLSPKIIVLRPGYHLFWILEFWHNYKKVWSLLATALPDGIFSNQKAKFGYILEGLHGRCCYIYGQLAYITAIWYILWPFGIFLPFWYVIKRKIWQPCSRGPILKEIICIFIIFRSVYFYLCPMFD
jgi:hypothetical protein